jgi:IK cytokine
MCRREVDERERDPAFVSDAYAECYPGYHDYNIQVVDSDDEADYTHMDSKLGKSRTEFNTEEEWQVCGAAISIFRRVHFGDGLRSASLEEGLLQEAADVTLFERCRGVAKTYVSAMQEYKSNKEMMPKAAFQFGVKATDGRKMGNKLGKARDNKINSQLNKIQSMLEKDSGDKYKAAFSAPESVEVGKISKKRRI